MKNAEVISLIIANAHKTKNLRAFAGKWYTGAARIPNETAIHVGKIIALLQAKIGCGEILNKDAEYLLIYNFQPVLFVNRQLYCSMECLIRPITDIDKIEEKTGQPIQFFINSETKEVYNVTKGLLDMKLITMEEIQMENQEPPIIHGRYDEYEAISGCLAIPSTFELDPKELFLGHYDTTEEIRNAVPFDTWTEALHMLPKSEKPYQYIAEFQHSKEELSNMLKNGDSLGPKIIKVFLVHDRVAEPEVISNPLTYGEEARIEDEIWRVTDAFKEPITPVIQYLDFEDLSLSV